MGRSATRKRTLRVRPEPATLAGFRGRPAQVIVDKSLSGSSCRALPATRRAACEGGMITDVLGRRHMRDRALPG
eukprot:2552174-Prymnesium_polylepis.1